ncbi:MAG: tRNA (guanine-N1)-methyltransferase [Halothece sp.]
MKVEGKAKFAVDNAFYRSKSQVVRDLGVLAAKVYQMENGHLRVLDAMSGCGVRSLRYYLESDADWIWANEGNPENAPILQHNLQEILATGNCQITHLDANRVFFDCSDRQDYYDLVDVDCFGSGVPYLNTSLWAVKKGGLLYFTVTDGLMLSGHNPNKSLADYGVYARSHPASQEQGLRLVIGAVQQQAATKGFGIKPIFSLFASPTFRVMLRLVNKPFITPKNYGFLGYCHSCGHYQTISWRQLGKANCPNDNSFLTLTGPMWLGELHSSKYIEKMANLAREWEWKERVSLLETMEAEANFPPYYYTLGEIGRRGKMDVPKRSHLIQALQENGYKATETHINPQAIKTNANFNDCMNIARSLTDT